MWIILGTQVYHHHLEHPSYRRFKCFRANLKCFRVPADPVPCLQLEVFMRLYDQRLLVVVRRQTVVHGVPESFPIMGCWPQLEYVVSISNEALVVGDKLGKTRCYTSRFVLFADVLNRIQQELQCR